MSVGFLPLIYLEETYRASRKKQGLVNAGPCGYFLGTNKVSEKFLMYPITVLDVLILNIKVFLRCKY